MPQIKQDFKMINLCVFRFKIPFFLNPPPPAQVTRSGDRVTNTAERREAREAREGEEVTITDIQRSVHSS